MRRKIIDGYLHVQERWTILYKNILLPDPIFLPRVRMRSVLDQKRLTRIRSRSIPDHYLIRYSGSRSDANGKGPIISKSPWSESSILSLIMISNQTAWAKFSLERHIYGRKLLTKMGCQAKVWVPGKAVLFSFL